jgi:hypothetical protein
MPLIQKTVYIREEDVPAWKALKNKAAFIHNALSGTVLQEYTDARVVHDKKIIPQVPSVFAISTITPASSAKLCKIHGTPLTPSGKCLWKGCKYA